MLPYPHGKFFKYAFRVSELFAFVLARLASKVSAFHYLLCSLRFFSARASKRISSFVWHFLIHSLTSLAFCTGHSIKMYALILLLNPILRAIMCRLFARPTHREYVKDLCLVYNVLLSFLFLCFLHRLACMYLDCEA